MTIALLAATASAAAQQVDPGLAPGAKAQASTTDPAPDRIVILGMIPIPNVGEGAPYYTTQELEAQRSEVMGQHSEAARGVFKCRDPVASIVSRVPQYRATLERLYRNELELANIVGGLATRAADATAAAEKARRDVAARETTMAQVEAAELNRQQAVNKLVGAKEKLEQARLQTAEAQSLYREAELAPEDKKRKLVEQITWGELEVRAAKRAKSIEADQREHEKVFVHIVSAIPASDQRGEYLNVSGLIRNDRPKPIHVPDLQISTVDSKGWVLTANIVTPPNGTKLTPGATYRFEYQLRPAPTMTEGVAVGFYSRNSPPPRLDPNMLCAS